MSGLGEFGLIGTAPVTGSEALMEGFCECSDMARVKVIFERVAEDDVVRLQQRDFDVPAMGGDPVSSRERVAGETEGAADEEPAHGVELDEAKSLDANPSDNAKDDNDRNFEMIVGHSEREDGADGGDAVEEENGAAGSEAAVEEAVMDVAAVRS